MRLKKIPHFKVYFNDSFIPMASFRELMTIYTTHIRWFAQICALHKESYGQKEVEIIDPLAVFDI
ncbi:hypothetical protein HQ35_07925 [Porphyromonas cangingivalis]|uniref:Uncharacterized protein n=1 Tax=Porphyromonas cangingivalis TaxID=36874 RepID=A0A0A2EP11_PORCN|nr:hypothetical protein HQ35_07925 [Porphyromonas cangingivalis]